MVILGRKATGCWKKESAFDVALYEVETATHDFRYLLSHGWRLIVEGESPRGDLLLDVQSDEGGGSFAEVKMKTLKDPALDKFYTGGDDLDFIKTLIQSEVSISDSKMAQQTWELKRAGDLTRKQHEWLRDAIGYTNFYGAICVPYTEIYVPEDDELEQEDFEGEIRISFSGASEEQDVMFALRIFRALQFNHCHLGDTIRRYDLGKIRAAANIRLWMDQLRLKEAPRISDFDMSA